VARAVRAGHPLYLEWTVVSAAFSCLPDFDACLNVLERHGSVWLEHAGYTACWFHLLRGFALVGAGRPGAVAALVAAARMADQVVLLTELELVVRLLAVAAADVGLLPQAVQLASYASTQLAAHRMDFPHEDWIGPRLDAALQGVPGDERARQQANGSALTRRQLINLIATVIESPAPEPPPEPTLYRVL